MNYNVDKSYKSIFEGRVVKTEYATEFTYHNCNLLDEMAKGFTEIYKKTYHRCNNDTMLHFEDPTLMPAGIEKI